MFEQLITPMFDVQDGSILPNGRPGLGIELNMDVVEKYRVDVDTREYLNLDGPNIKDATGQWIRANGGK